MKIKVVVRPNSKHEKIEKISDKEYRMWVKASPIDGKANEAVIHALASFFSVPKSSITIIHGLKGKVKIIDM